MRLFLIPFLCLFALPCTVYSQAIGGGGGGGFGGKTIMTKQIEHSDVDQVVAIMSELFDIKFSINKNANTIYARATEEQIKEATAFIEQLEKANAEAEEKRKKNGRGSGLGTLRGNKSSRPFLSGGGGLSALGGQPPTMKPPKRPRKPSSFGVLGNVSATTNGKSVIHFDGIQLDIEKSLVPLITELANTTAELGPESPKVKGLSQKIDSIRKSVTDLTQQIGIDIASLEKDLAPLVVDLAKTRTEFGPEHPKVRLAEKQLETAREAMRSALAASRKQRAAVKRSAKYALQHAALETEVSKVVAKLREGNETELPEEEVKDIKVGLEESVGKLFDVRQQAEEADLKQAEQQLEKIRKRLDDRKNNRDKIVKERVEELLEDGSK